MVRIQPLMWQDRIDGLSDGLHPFGLFLQHSCKQGVLVIPLTVDQRKRVGPSQAISTSSARPEGGVAGRHYSNVLYLVLGEFQGIFIPIRVAFG